MKKLLLVLSIFIVEQASGVAKDELVKYDFYNHRVGLSNEEQYKQFIYPYLEEARDQLKVIQYCFNHAIKFSQWYIQILAEYSAAVFNRIALGEGTRRIQALESKLLDKIKIYKDITNSTLDIQEELDKTVDLIKRVNEEYYKKIGLVDRISFWGQRQFNKIFRDKISDRENKLTEEVMPRPSIDKAQLTSDLKKWIINENVYEVGLKNPQQALGQGNPELEQDLKELRGWGADNWIGWKQDRVAAFCKKYGIEDININALCEEVWAKARPKE